MCCTHNIGKRAKNVVTGVVVGAREEKTASIRLTERPSIVFPNAIARKMLLSQTCSVCPSRECTHATRSSPVNYFHSFVRSFQRCPTFRRHFFFCSFVLFVFVSHPSNDAMKNALVFLGIRIISTGFLHVFGFPFMTVVYISLFPWRFSSCAQLSLYICFPQHTHTHFV